MNRDRRRALGIGAILVSITAGISYVAAGSHGEQQVQVAQGSVQQKAEGERPAAEGLNAIHSTRLPATQKMIERAIQHVEAGHQQEALRELMQARNSLEAVRQAIGRHIEPSVANDHCPIMGSRILTNTVPVALTRMHDGRKVIFCCAGCPEAWDQLDDAQKTAKLASVAAKPQQRRTPSRSAPTRPPQPQTPSRSAPVRPPQHKHH